MVETKAWWQSKTIIVGIIGGLFGVLSFFKVLPVELDQEQIVSAVLAVTGVLAAVFRKGATAEIAPQPKT